VSHAQRLHSSFMAGGLMIGAAVMAQQTSDRAARAEARQAVHEAATGTVARWQAYARRLEHQLAEARAREAQLAQDLADALQVIEAQA